MLFRSPRPIRSVLIANRGEIAMRIIGTCARMGLRTVAVYSDADADAMHVRAADEAVSIGRAPARESYLDMAAVIEAALRTEVDAIHPGYGFLSENAAFARLCDKAGLIFVGPSAEAVANMGSKIESKRIAESAGVPTVPGYHGDAQDRATLASAAEAIGFPVLIKASAGGGGRGMRRVNAPDEFADALLGARAEAEAAFDDSRVLLEKYILNPRHLEIQIAGDRCGGLVHLFERDCSVQRNNQKVLEEAPAPNLPESVRRRLHEAALMLGRAIGYDSVGTVEFIMDAGSDQPFFLEMNTRLQVEHPVTELVTGVDLVEWQLLAAAGEPLPLEQSGLRLRGHAIEARITAERADRDFQPATGRLVAVGAPRGLRFDSGVEAGSEIGLYYDSLLAKIVAHGATRDSALERLASGLQSLTMLGVATTQPFLRDAVRHPLFADGQATTRFIPMAFPQGWRPGTAELSLLRAAATACFARSGPAAASWTSPWLQRSAVRVTSSVRPARTAFHLVDDYGAVDIDLCTDRSGMFAEIDGAVVKLGALSEKGEDVVLSLGGEDMVFGVRHENHLVHITRNGLAISASIVAKIDVPRVHGAHDRGGNVIEAALHGVVSKLHVAVGDTVEKGAPVLQMEAMKLIHTLVAPVSGRIAAIHCTANETVAAAALLVEITPDG